MNYRFLRVAAGLVYPPMRAAFAQKMAAVGGSYRDLQQHLFAQRYHYSDSFSRAMARLGNEASEVVFDSELLQKTWAAEHGLALDAARWKYQVLLAQIRHYRPDLILFHGTDLPLEVHRQLRQESPTVRFTAAFSGFPAVGPENFGVDMMLAGTPEIAALYAAQGIKTRLFYHAFDDGVLAVPGVKAGGDPGYRFTFVGSSGYGYGPNHATRYWTLLELLRQTDIELWIYEHTRKSSVFGRLRRQNPKVALRDLLLSLLGGLGAGTLRQLAAAAPAGKLGNLAAAARDRKQQALAGGPAARLIPPRPLGQAFPQRCHDPLFGLEMYQVLARSQVTANIHTDAAGHSVGNIRLFEATGVGTCLLTNGGANLSDLFAADTEVVTYASIEECVEKARFLLEHETARQHLAAAGQRRTLQDHTVFNRCQQLDEIARQQLR